MILLKNISKKINGVAILDNVSLRICKGEFVAIIGQSGSGKTSLLNIIGTLDEPSSGEYFLDNYDVNKASKDEKARLRREKIGFIFQRYNLLNLLNAKENVALPAVYAGKNKNERLKKAKELLSFLELDHKEFSKPNQLSGGQQQRVSIARALINGGELILADEPTGALDSKSGKIVLEILTKLNEQGHTIVLVTHDPCIAAMAKRVIEIKDGKIIKDSNPKELINPDKKIMSKERKSFSLLKNQIIESFKMSIAAIIAHKLRSLLTMLGIIIGIASVVCVVALGLGAQQSILASISSIGTNTIEVVSGRGLGDIRSGKTRLNLSDLKTLSSLPYLEAVEADVGKVGVVTYKSNSLQARIYGVGPNHLKLRGLVMVDGRFINYEDINDNTNICIVDENALRILFENANARSVLGKSIIFNKQPLTIVGVLKRERDNKGFRADENTIKIYTPYTTLMNKITGDKQIRAIVTKVKDEVNPSLAEEAMIKILEIKRGQKDFFTINSDAIKNAVEENTATLTLLVSSIAVVSLIVGGIGVMNIMLVSVSERTREIGVRMAIGARKEDILMQFLIEAVLICSFGAIFGVLLSFVIVEVFNSLGMGFTMILSLNSIFLGLLSSVLIGLVFGFFPAKNAANLNPINALSKE
ncbi:MacB family efflux pump subunit [Campylobacter volucris]|uniref:Pyoverdine export ATP-binding/permease protein PvdT n=1 Tax=Campylobacter volucris TaxID=1031542 RepID=A0AAE6CYU8_9BACT|nr:MacB family efflux pump subunit [Campylobacter volucris]AJC94198.1 macrolide-specific efflux protein, ATP-binding/permease protein MacB [Campylobacter volucris LMG 24379]KAB0580354.1 MacB family efflux pump subunit [Campylobacter volucris]QBL13434.1 MacB family efflux pump subunit [Campylobacter volucris]QEL08414.1 macrolide-specific efflux protein, ATP-binding/permease protein MacB [Campylobacter volucris]TXK70470.1 MacB family efflux pump subunit [Campylobacter volucris]